MRFIIISFFLFAGYISANGQLRYATLQAAGLTCAMCSNAIYQSLSSLPFIAEVAPDVANSSFQIKFKADKNIEPDRMRNAVEEAGFSVAALRFTISFTNFELPYDKILSMNGMKLYVINSTDQVFDKDVIFLFLDKGFLTEKMLKEYEKKLSISLRKNKKDADNVVYTVMINQEGL
jgi:copper chaperone CopZ